MERRSGTWDLGSGSSWPFVIFLLFLCPALVSLAGKSQVKLCQWCCFQCCCCYLCFFQVVVFIVFVIISSFHVVVVYTFSAVGNQHLCWVSMIPLLSLLFFFLLFTYLIFVICHLFFYSSFVVVSPFCYFTCCSHSWYLSILLQTRIIWAWKSTSKVRKFATKNSKIGQNFAFSLLKGTPTWRTLCDL